MSAVLVQLTQAVTNLCFCHWFRFNSNFMLWPSPHSPCSQTNKQILCSFLSENNYKKSQWTIRAPREKSIPLALVCFKPSGFCVEAFWLSGDAKWILWAPVWLPLLPGRYYSDESNIQFNFSREIAPNRICIYKSSCKLWFQMMSQEGRWKGKTVYLSNHRLLHCRSLAKQVDQNDSKMQPDAQKPFSSTARKWLAMEGHLK